MPETTTMPTNPPETRLKELGLTLPTIGRPLASYLPWTRTGNLVYIAGQIPMREGKPAWTGRVGKEITLQQSHEVARHCVLQALAIIKEAAGGLDRVARVVRTTNYVNAAPGFTDIHLVANGASDFLVQVFGESGKHARVSIGVAELPFNVPFEIDLIVEVT